MNVVRASHNHQCGVSASFSQPSVWCELLTPMNMKTNLSKLTHRSAHLGNIRVEDQCSGCADSGKGAQREGEYFACTKWRLPPIWTKRRESPIGF